MSIFETDIWRIGVIKAPLAEVIAKGIEKIHWLQEEPDLRFLADPFGIYKDNKLYIFAEAYDYKERHGRIQVLILDQALNLIDRRIVLSEPWHLSYPMLVEDQGNIYMLPEAYKSGKASLYRAVNFPYQWEKVPSFSFPEQAIDPTVLFYNNLWWMFYTPVQEGLSKRSVLSVAWAETLTGQWHNHRANPVRITPAGARSGGNALVTSEGIILPTQDCSLTYGGDLAFLKITNLTSDNFEAQIIGRLQRDKIFGEYSDGIHTLSSAGPFCLIDAKKIINRPFKRFIADRYYQAYKWSR